MLIAAFVLTFGTALQLLLNPVPPVDIPTFDEVFADFYSLFSLFGQ